MLLNFSNNNQKILYFTPPKPFHLTPVCRPCVHACVFGLDQLAREQSDFVSTYLGTPIGTL